MTSAERTFSVFLYLENLHQIPTHAEGNAAVTVRGLNIVRIFPHILVERIKLYGLFFPRFGRNHSPRFDVGE